MNKGIWKFLTILGLLLAGIAFAMILVFRLQVFGRVDFFTQTTRLFIPQTEQSSVSQTQLLTQQDEISNIQLDKQNLARLQQGCFLGNDCIPSIDQPQFVSVRLASFMQSNDLVIGFVFQENSQSAPVVKAYPVKILNWHEIVNDVAGNTPIAVTYCPLCMTPRVFDRILDGKAVTFGVSGMLLNSNLVMYDRETKSLWSQFDGLALVGSKRDQKLQLYPSQLEKWSDWIKQYPQTQVLSEKTGYALPYNQYPYDDYEKNSDIYFPLEHIDNRFPPKEVVFGIVLGNQEKVYPESELQKALPNGGSFSDQFAGKNLTVSYDKKTFNVTDAQTREQILNTVSYYFTWAAFYPNTEIYQAQI